jgi:8-oxo-dGTP pyrophosphatase MutT (NUDIX family)
LSAASADPARDSPTPAVPRPAASVLLVRDSVSSSAGVEVYMIRRNRGMKFLGGYYAFPGGKVDAGDRAPDTLARVRGIDADEAARRFTDGVAPIAYWVAAARELLEETGVLLACDVHGRPIDAAQAAIDTCRRELMDGVAFADALARRDWYGDLRALRYLSHFTTPPRSPIRFTARFFLCPLAPGQAPRLFTEETSEGFWIAPDEAYWRFVDDEMAMAEPAEYALGYLAQFASLDELWAAHADGHARFEGISHRGDTIADDWKAARFAYRVRPRP